MTTPSGIHFNVHSELIVELRGGAEAAAVENWLRQHGLDVLPLTVGLLASGEEDAVRKRADRAPTSCART